EKGQMVYNGSPSEVFSNKDLLSRGVAFPQVALLSHEMKMLNKPFDYITITKSQAKEQIMKRMGS
ncbi:hypothetical protein ACFWDG_25635, partial [Peribacillus sp. NPDC060186]